MPTVNINSGPSLKSDIRCWFIQRNFLKELAQKKFYPRKFMSPTDITQQYSFLMINSVVLLLQLWMLIQGHHLSCMGLMYGLYLLKSRSNIWSCITSGIMCDTSSFVLSFLINWELFGSYQWHLLPLWWCKHQLWCTFLSRCVAESSVTYYLKLS